MNESECCICMEPLSDINLAVTKCGHKFCLECLLKHYKTKNDCPLCRSELVKNEISGGILNNVDHSDYIMYMQEENEVAEIIRENERMERLYHEQLQHERERNAYVLNPIRHIMGLFTPVRRNSQPRCGICRQRGHNRRTCPVRYEINHRVTIR